MATGLKSLLAAMLLCVPQLVAAESLPDPTRPAIDLSVGTGSGTGGAGAATEAAQHAVLPQGLQTIIISPQYRAAIIDGETVRLGGKSGDSRLVEIRENSVVLQNSKGRRVMELFPSVGIKKNEAAPQKNNEQDNSSAQPTLQEKAVGGDK